MIGYFNFSASAGAKQSRAGLITFGSSVVRQIDISTYASSADANGHLIQTANAVSFENSDVTDTIGQKIFEITNTNFNNSWTSKLWVIEGLMRQKVFGKVIPPQRQRDSYRSDHWWSARDINFAEICCLNQNIESSKQKSISKPQARFSEAHTKTHESQLARQK